MFTDPVREHASARPDARALISDSGTLVWKSLDAAVDHVAGVLAEAGVHPGERVAVDARPAPPTVLAFHAIWRLGAAVAPVHPGLTDTERSAAFRVIRPAVWVGGGERVTGFDGRTVDPSQWMDLVRDPGAETPRSSLATSPDDPAAILWTSGSTGAPRGVVLPGRSFTFNARATATRLGLGPDDVWMATLGLAHVGGLAMVARAAHIGSAIVVRGAFSPETFHADCQRDGVTHASLVPTMVSRLVERAQPAPKTLQAVLVGGAAATPAVVHQAIELGYPIALTYGMTEAGSQIATATPEETARDPESVGCALEGVELRVDTRGEIVVRSPGAGIGVIGEPSAVVDDDGWIHTGDGGTLDSDGKLRVVGRLDHRLISGGVNVDPLEVERALIELPGVLAACVVGLPDAEWGHRIEAMVTVAQSRPSDGVWPDPAGRAGALRDALGTRLSAAKVPKRIWIADSLPLTRNGKVDREAVADALAQGRALDPSGPAGSTRPL